MTQKMLSEDELIRKARSSSNPDELEEYAQNPYSNVRRVVAKNIYTTVAVINQLAEDPVRNVSYAALMNSKCTSNRKKFIMKEERRCVVCPISEERYSSECQKCNNSYSA